jgi:chorismate synthase
MKYGPCDDAIGAGFFSGRYTSTIVAAGYTAKKVLKRMGIDVFSFIREAAGVRCPEMDSAKILDVVNRYKKMRRDTDPFYQNVYVGKRIHMDMRFLEKMKVFAEIEQQIDTIRQQGPRYSSEQIRDQYGVHAVVNCPDWDTAEAMLVACNRITQTGDSSGGVIEVIVRGAPIGLGEPVFSKLDAELGRMLGIGAVKGVEVGAGFAVKNMTGIQSNDAMRSNGDKVEFLTNNSGGITGGLSSGQDIVVRLAVKPTPTIDKAQQTIDKYTLANTQLAAITRRDPTIVGRIWPVAENYTSLVVLDNLMMHYGYQTIKERWAKG